MLSTMLTILTLMAPYITGGFLIILGIYVIGMTLSRAWKSTQPAMVR